MPLFNVAVREHAYTGWFYSDVVQAESSEEALQVAAEQAAAPEPAPEPKPLQRFDVAVTEPTYTGRLDTDVVRVEPHEEAQPPAAAPEPSPGPTPRADAADRPRCADVWVYSLLDCELVAGHDPPHMAVAGYERPVRWVRDDRGIAHALTDSRRSS